MLNPDNLRIGYEKAADLCSRREYCSSDIKRKLLLLKLTTEECEAVLQRLVNEKFIDHSRYARAFVRDKSRFAGWGKIKITAALRAKQIEADVIKEALNELTDEATEEQVRKEAQKKLRSLRDIDNRIRKQKLARYLLSKGFESPIVWKIAAELIKEGGGEDFE
jgi:regulatory protein